MEEIKLEEARKAIQSVLEAIRRIAPDKAAAVAVVDSHGELIVFARMDGVQPVAAEMARNKAYTAARAHRTTADLGSRVAEGIPLGSWGDTRFTGFGGGVPVRIRGRVIGAVGVSGLPSEADIQAATLGAEMLSAG